MEDENKKTQYNTNMNQTIIENKSKINGKKKLPIIILISLSIVLIGISVILLISKNNKSENSKGNNSSTESKELVEKELKDNDAKKKIDEFLDTIEESSDYIKYQFMFGDYMSNSNEIYVSLHSLIKNNKYTKLTNNNLPNKYKNNDHYKQSANNGCLIQISFDDIEKENHSLFGTEPKFEIQDLKNVNDLMCYKKEEIYDEELKLFLINTCTCDEGNASSTIYISKYKYTYDSIYYYLYLYTGTIKEKDNTESDDYGLYKLSNNEKVDVDSFEGNEEKFDKIQLKFNKNFTFAERKLITDK